MVQIVAIIMIFVAGYIIVSGIKQRHAKVSARERRQKQKTGRPEEIETLIRDPETGVYRPKDPEDRV